MLSCSVAEVNHSEGLLLRHRFDLLQPLRGGLGLPQQLCYALPNAQGPFGGEARPLHP